MGNPVLNLTTGLLRLGSIVVCMIVVIAFILFASNQAGDATSQQLTLLGNTSNSITATGATGTTAQPPGKSETPRQYVTDASNTLTSPFHNVFGTTSAWGMHISQLVIALLVYGFGVGFLLRAVRMRHE